MKMKIVVAVTIIASLFMFEGGTTVGAAGFDDPNVQALHKSVAEMRVQAAKGDPQAQTGVGMISYFGFGGAQDYAAAKGWFEKAAAQGYPEAMVQLGNLYENGFGVETDVGKAIDLYRKGAEKNYPQARFRLGLLYLGGAGVAKDEVEGEKLLQAACDQGYRTSCGVLMWRADKIDEASVAFNLQCQAGDQLACGFQAQLASAGAAVEGGRDENGNKGQGGVGLYLVIGLALVGLLIFWLIRNDPGEEEGKAE